MKFSPVMKLLRNVNILDLLRLILRHKKTVLNILTDKILFRIRTPFPRAVSICITNKCNFNCPMCVNASFRNSFKGTDDFSMHDFNSILPELIQNKPFVYITGGEPLLHKDIFTMIGTLSKNGIFTAITTNGSLVSKFSEEIVESGLGSIAISLDHMNRDIHDKGRGYNGSFDLIMKGVKNLILSRGKGIFPRIKIGTVITPDNYSEIEAIYDFVNKMGVDEWNLQHYSFLNPEAVKRINHFKQISKIQADYIDGTIIDTPELLNGDQVDLLIKQIYNCRGKSKVYKTKFYCRDSIRNLKDYYLGKAPSQNANCYFYGLNYLSIFNSIKIINGNDLSLCFGYPIGKTTGETPINKAWNSDKALTVQNYLKKHKNIPYCFRCCFLNFESGSEKAH